MRLPYAAGPDEGDVAVRVEVGQRRELAQRGRVPALDPGEVEALEGLGLAPGQPAQPQQRLDGGEPPFLFSLAVASLRGELSSGKVPTTLVPPLLISRLMRSIPLFVLIRRQCTRSQSLRLAEY